MAHDGIEYHVGLCIHDEFDKAAKHAMLEALRVGEAHLDVIIWSEGAARAYGGDDAVARYLEDPDASVFERYEIRVNAVGRVP